jgi:hypothetical protein
MIKDREQEHFIADTDGESQQIPSIIYDNIESLKMSVIQARERQYTSMPMQALALDGIPGLPIERGEPNPDIFYQGEDIIFDLFLYMDGKPVKSDEYEILASLKTSPRALNEIWAGSYGDGIDKSADTRDGYYELWISSACTERLLAGTYYLSIAVNQRLGEGKGKHDRKFVLLTHAFALGYSNFSKHPETMSNSSMSAKRSDAEPTWPNTPNTIVAR